MKNKKLLYAIASAILIFPWVLFEIIVNMVEKNSGNDSAQAAGMLMGFTLMVVTPMTLIVGVIVTMATSTSKRWFLYSILGFLIPTILVSAFFVSGAF